MPHLPVAGGGVPLYDAALAEFTAMRVAHTMPALQALSAAQRLDDPSTSDASRSPLSKEFSRLRADALREVVGPDDPIHILQQRVKAKRNDDEQAYAHWMARWEALPPSVRNPNPETW
jgi:hypothetical protein